jgi:hypothetical protein
MTTRIKLAILFSFLTCLIVAQPDTTWTRCFGGSGEDPNGLGTGIAGAPAVSMVQDTDGFIYIATYTTSSNGYIHQNAGIEDFWIIKLNVTGDTIWSKTIGGENFERCYDLKLLNDGSLLVVGKSASTTGLFSAQKGGEDGILIKLTRDGNIIWLKHYGGSNVETLYGALEIPGGDIMAYGISGSIDGDISDPTYVGSNKAWLMRISPTGMLIWSRITNALTPDPDWEESFNKATLTLDGAGILLAGASYNFNDVNSDDIFVCKYALNGTQLFKKTYGGNAGDSPTGIVTTADSGMVVSAVIRAGGGDVTNFFGGNTDFWLLKLNKAGNLVWNQNYGGSNLDYPFNLQLDGNAVLQVGSTKSTDQTASKPALGGFDCWLVWVNPDNGDTLKTVRWGSTGNDHAHATVYSGVGLDYLTVAGRSNGNDLFVHGNNGGTDVYVSQFKQASIAGNEPIQKSRFKLSCFPNPVSEVLTLQLTGIARPLRYEVRDLTGRTMEFGSISDQKSISTSAWVAGIYLIRVFSETEFITEKVVVE